jgi:hypothetical protein
MFWKRSELMEAICPLDYHEAGLIIDDDSKSPCTSPVIYLTISVSFRGGHEGRKYTLMPIAILCLLNPFLLVVG